jgi:PBP1b-binding outer membrane lipoprotein LpoB
MKLLQAAAAVLFVLFVAGCATKPMAPQPAAAVTPAPSGTFVSMTPPMTTYGCDAVIARRMGKSC